MRTNYTNELKKLSYIIPIISMLVIIPFFSESFSQETLLPLETGIISTHTTDYEISSEFDIRVIGDGDIIRMKGMTVSGNPYYVYQQMIDGEPIIFGKIFIDGIAFPVIHKIIESIKVEQKTPESIDIKKNIVVITDHTDSSKFYERFFISVKVYDEDVNPNPLLFSKTDGLLKDIPIMINITDSKGNMIDFFKGKTDKGGSFYEEYYWKYNDLAGSYIISLNVNNGDYTEYLTTYYQGYIKTNSTGT